MLIMEYLLDNGNSFYIFKSIKNIIFLKNTGIKFLTLIIIILLSIIT